jgi:nitroreductase
MQRRSVRKYDAKPIGEDDLHTIVEAGRHAPSAANRQPWHVVVIVAIAMENMMLAATALGYGTCWIGAFDPERVKSLLEVPEDMRVVALTPVGASADQPEPRPRQPLSEFASLDRYGKKLG